MSIDVQQLGGYDDVLLIVFRGDWSWHDFFQMTASMRSLLNSHVTPAHFILDFGESTAEFDNPVRLLRYFAVNVPEKTRAGLHVYVSASRYWRSAVAAFNRTYSGIASDTVFVSDMESALTAIARKRDQIAL